ncbi:HNH endonuclease [Haloarcula virus HVTV-2]|uniref:HNH nuclease domain-containing protein n=1 Tax=Haloarcula vallismortis tailed virus 1 TaxID=1262528 RepID=L7TI46_9CAUD|nr:endonuclease [Haloarcula vallismortis tailed virus 1]AGC34516.1 hypothetical protein HVTV1_147 [Haloarcula vallismortis tailed virus 1]UBF22956.1 HNH endonuclease [Haloarcula virus HVTV-2]
MLTWTSSSPCVSRTDSLIPASRRRRQAVFLLTVHCSHQIYLSVTAFVCMGRPSVPLEKRFWDKVDRGDEDECWEWQAATVQGYGLIGVDGTETERAHRVAYRLEVEDPGDDWVLHHCDNPACVNPEHLYLGDAEDNAQDREERGRSTYHTGEEHGNTSLTEEQVARIKWLVENTARTNVSIADEYGVSDRTIGNIASGATWAGVSPKK